MIHVVAAFLEFKDKFLITQRAKGELKGYWEFPGGKIEKDEDHFSAIKRELREELDINVNPTKIIKAFSHTYPFARIKLFLIQCKISKNIVIKSDGSHSNFEWVTLDEAQKKEFAPLDKKILSFLKKA